MSLPPPAVLLALPGTEDPGATRILVVDDERSLTRILRSMLEHDGHSVEECSSTEGLVDRIVASPPDLAILDYHMPGMSGLEVLAALRERTGDRVPVIMLTGESENIDVAVRSLKVGAMDYLVKPVAMERLLSSVRTTLRIHRLQVEMQRLRVENAALWGGGAPAVVVGDDGKVRRMNPAALAWLGEGVDGQAVLSALGPALGQLPPRIGATAKVGIGAETGQATRSAIDEILVVFGPVPAPAARARSGSRATARRRRG